jgi:hypothetical protein
MGLRSRLAARRARKAAEQREELMAQRGQTSRDPNAPYVSDTSKEGGFFRRGKPGVVTTANVPKWAMDFNRRLATLSEAEQKNILDQLKAPYEPVAAPPAPTIPPYQTTEIPYQEVAAPEIPSFDFNFAPIEQQARTGFAQQTMPSIAERFSSLGSGGSQRSSAFPQALSQAGQGLEEQLAALRAQYGFQGAERKAEYGMRGADLGIRRADLGMRGAELGMRQNQLASDYGLRGLALQQQAQQFSPNLALQQREMELRRQALRSGMLGNMMTQGLSPVYQSAYKPGTQAGAMDLLNSLIKSTGEAGGKLLGTMLI